MSAISAAFVRSTSRQESEAGILFRRGWGVKSVAELGNNLYRVTLLGPENENNIGEQLCCSSIYSIAALPTALVTLVASLFCLPCACHDYFIEEAECYDNCCDREPTQISTYSESRRIVARAPGNIEIIETTRTYRDQNFVNQVNASNRRDWTAIKEARKQRRETGQTDPESTSGVKRIIWLLSANSELYRDLQPLRCCSNSRTFEVGKNFTYLNQMRTKVTERAPLISKEPNS